MSLVAERELPKLPAARSNHSCLHPLPSKWHREEHPRKSHDSRVLSAILNHQYPAGLRWTGDWPYRVLAEDPGAAQAADHSWSAWSRAAKTLQQMKLGSQ